MPSAPVDFHSSRYPEAVKEQMRLSLRGRRMDHQFHYVTSRQAARWLALHQRYSPSRQDPDCEAIYDSIFARCAAELSGQVQLIGLGCGGGKKDARLIRALQSKRLSLRYVAADVSPSLVSESRERVQEVTGIPLKVTRGLVADFMHAPDLGAYWAKGKPGKERQLFSFLGMLPNFDPHQALSLLSSWLGDEDLLVLSANLAPGPDYAEGCTRILPQYDNVETRHWLVTVMEDLGFEVGVEHIRFEVVEQDGIKRVEAVLIFPEKGLITYEGSEFSFEKGESFRLFYSNRFQPGQLETILGTHGFSILERAITKSGEEGAWVVRKSFPVEV